MDAGSSPLARGTLRTRFLVFALVGLIPARAGNTPISTALERMPPAHPRSRGEHDFSSSSFFCPAGSSPLARGTRQRQS